MNRNNIHDPNFFRCQCSSKSARKHCILLLRAILLIYRQSVVRKQKNTLQIQLSYPEHFGYLTNQFPIHPDMISQQQPSNVYDQLPPLFASPQATQEKSQSSWATLQAIHCLVLQCQQELYAGNV
ncbi:Os03g0775250 [Oryza sativa Japonica Group]|uniref:Os03g0775250 protein n=1 Tax=Oryza sativa subsp. japonica TaxID=39947 RepID=A0A0P0W470_ORYSJ|nr:hypothetical protein EE612_020746 [Oryza sativa]BAS86626.1 Os03g0775250 [Oryza sativa Japonica Group]